MTDPAGPAAARIALFVGKGGVGKSTLAAATAVCEARAGRRVLVVSTDQAQSLGDVLDAAVPATGDRRVTRILGPDDTAGGDGYVGPARGGTLDALALDTLALLEQRWAPVAAALAARYTDSDVAEIAPEELSALPGVEEVLGLHAVAELAGTGDWDVVVVDCASTADALRMLTLPGAFGLYLERAWPRHRRLSAADDDPATARVVAALERTAAAVEQLAALLTDGDRLSAHLVLTAERVVAAETMRTMGSLALVGVRIAELIVNQVLVRDESYEYRNLPAHPAFDWYAARLAEQQAVLDDLAERTGDTELLLAPHLAAEPTGPAALADLLAGIAHRDGGPPPGPIRPVVDRESGSGVDAVYRLRVELPLVDPAALTLGRAGDELVIGAGGVRRRVTLASVLRRCEVSDAQLRGTELTVRFRPDPRVWPA